MNETEIVVEQDWQLPEWNVTAFPAAGGAEWLAAFSKKEDAEEWADQKRLEP